MRDSTYKFTLDVHDVASQVQIVAKQNDNARKIIANLMENGKPYALDIECRAVFMCKKPDGNVLYNDCDVINKGSAISYDFTQQTTAVTGIHECEIRIYGADDEIITSPRFTILVTPNVYQDGQVSSTSEFNALTDIVSDVAEGLAEINQAVSDVNDALDDINDALDREQDILDTADTVLTNATTYATNAQTSATNAAASATAAATSETNASTYATNASDSALVSEGYATGTQNGVAVGSTSPYYENNSKYFKEAIENMNITVDWSNVENKPASYPPSTHNHDDLYYGKSDVYQKTETYSKTEVDGMIPTSMDWRNITNTPTDYPPSSHNHNDLYYSKTEIDGKKATSTALGLIKPDNTTTFVNSEGVLSAVGGGGGGGGVTVWGSITGDIANQTDLQTALSGKADSSTTYTKTEVDGLIPTISVATTTNAGTVKPDGTTITVDADGTIHGSSSYTLPAATITTLGGVIPDGTTITVDANGKISGATTYTLPEATTSSLGGVKADGTSITVDADGTIHSINGATPYTLPEATASTLGGVKIGSGVNVTSDGTISVDSYTLPTASTTTLGGVKVDNDTITITNGVISASGGGSVKSLIKLTTTDFAGQTVTCVSDGESLTTTFDSEGKASFKVAYVTTYTITCGTRSTEVEVVTLGAIYNVILNDVEPVDVTFLLEGAKEDTITMTDSNGTSLGTVVFESGQTTAEVTLTLTEDTEVTFTSGVAKDTTNGTSDYSKTVKICTDGKIMKDVVTPLVPTMTSNTAPSGEAISSGNYADTLPYLAFNGITTGDSGWVSPQRSTVDNWIGYKFTTSTCVNKFKYRPRYGNQVMAGFKLQGSNDLTNWIDIGEYTHEETTDLVTYVVDNDTSFIAYRIYCTQAPSGSVVDAHTLQFYYVESVKEAMDDISIPLVPTMTSNTTPSGEVIYSTYYSDSYAPYYAFANRNKSSQYSWTPSASDTYGNAYIGYKFTQPTIVNKIYAYSKNEASSATSVTVRFYASNNGTDWQMIKGDTVLTKNTDYYLTVDNTVAYLYYKMVIMSNQSGSLIYDSHGYWLQFYSVTKTIKAMPEGALYWYGNECEDITGGWNNILYGTVTKETNNLHATSLTSGYDADLGTSNTIDTSNYSKAVFIAQELDPVNTSNSSLALWNGTSSSRNWIMRMYYLTAPQPTGDTIAAIGDCGNGIKLLSANITNTNSNFFVHSSWNYSKFYAILVE